MNNSLLSAIGTVTPELEYVHSYGVLLGITTNLSYTDFILNGQTYEDNTMISKFIMVSTLSLVLMVSQAQAVTSEEKAAELGKTLTPIGAEMKGNADGSIPDWTGGLNSKNSKASADPGRPVDPYPDDKPLFTITKDNLDEHKAHLTPGQQAMFAKYADYQMPVYQTRRTAAYPQAVYDLAKKNAVTAELVAGGNGLKNFDTTIPFPVPGSGVEVIWNHVTRYRGGAAQREVTTIPVQTNGSFSPIVITDKIAWPEAFKDGRTKKDDNILFYYMQVITSPSRLTGSSLLVHETIDQVKEARKAWIYNTGLRRVRRAPNVAYDGPATGVDGLRTTDNFDMFNGAPDRYDWKLHGKKEIYIPYNSYKLLSSSLKYDDIIKKGHVNPEHLRYELHRVWHITAELKKGARHIYKKRDMYIDEDTWGAAVIDHYDGRDKLWRVSEAYAIQFYDNDTSWVVADSINDLNSGRYLVTGLSNELPNYLKWGYKDKAKRSDFSASALRRAGR